MKFVCVLLFLLVKFIPKKAFLTAFSHHFIPGMRSWRHPELSLRSCHCYCEGDHLQRNATTELVCVAKSELLPLILRQPKVLSFGDHSTRISQPTQRPNQKKSPKTIPTVIWNHGAPQTKQKRFLNQTIHFCWDLSFGGSRFDKWNHRL